MYKIILHDPSSSEEEGNGAKTDMVSSSSPSGHNLGSLTGAITRTGDSALAAPVLHQVPEVGMLSIAFCGSMTSSLSVKFNESMRLPKKNS